MDDNKARLLRKAEDRAIDMLVKVEAVDIAKADEILQTIGDGGATAVIKIKKAAEAFLAA